MSRGRFGYGSYRGRKTLNEILKLVAAVLAVLVVLAGAALWLGQKYIVYVDGGYRLDLPFFQREASHEPEEDDFLIAVEPAGSQSVPPEQTPEPEPEPPLAAVEVPLSAVAEGRAAELAAQAGANGVLLDMKTDQGQLGFVSKLAMAESAKANAQIEGIDAQIQALNQGELYTVARISCFKDHALARDESYAIRTNSGYRWTDPEELRWSSPTSGAVQDYLVALMVELAQLGFDEILLDNCGYPTQGNLGYIRRGEAYDLDGLSAVMETFLQKAQAALEPYEVKLSIRTTTSVLDGTDSRSGQTPALLETYAQRIWMEEPAQGQDLTELLTQAGITQAAERLVLLSAELTPGLDTAQAVRTP